MKFTVCVKMFEDNFDPRFAIDATDETDALGKARDWADHRGMSRLDVMVKPSTVKEATHWVHNEYLK